MLNERPESNQERVEPEMPMFESMEWRMQWLIVSKAADKSNRKRTEDCVSALAPFMACLAAARSIAEKK